MVFSPLHLQFLPHSLQLQNNTLLFFFFIFTLFLQLTIFFPQSINILIDLDPLTDKLLISLPQFLVLILKSLNRTNNVLRIMIILGYHPLFLLIPRTTQLIALNILTLPPLNFLRILRWRILSIHLQMLIRCTKIILMSRRNPLIPHNRTSLFAKIIIFMITMLWR